MSILGKVWFLVKQVQIVNVARQDFGNKET
ncbi:MAG: hypothetical protein K0S11_690 [Gammaproteobacteria bacterium]|nr:hypothetical protein [Gammaproteobacteria bacterium]